LRRGRLPSLVLMTDDERLPDPLAAAGALPRGSMVVIRARETKRRDELSRAILKLAHRKGLAVLIASDPEMAARLGADGLHLPEARMGETASWRARFPSLMITTTAHSFRALMLVRALPIDAVFLSPVFATRSHPDRMSLTPLRRCLHPMPLQVLLLSARWRFDQIWNCRCRKPASMPMRGAAL
jgi:thiamine-phosphate pyrophosphorylase